MIAADLVIEREMMALLSAAHMATLRTQAAACDMTVGEFVTEWANAPGAAADQHGVNPVTPEALAGILTLAGSR